MNGLILQLQVYLAYPFVRSALFAGTLIALAASLLGVTLVLKRFSYIGDGLSHVAFGAMAAAAVVGLTNKMLLILPVTILAAVLLLRNGGRIRGDAALAMLSVGALAFGYLLMNIFKPGGNVPADVCTTLFGSTSILTLSTQDVWLCAGLSAAVLILSALYYKDIFAMTFDEELYAATGGKASRINLLVAVVIAVVIVVAMNLVGALLVSALVVFPALSAMRIFDSYKAVLLFSSLSSAACAFLGILVSVLAGTPVGATIVAADTVLFCICWTAGRIREGGIG